MRGSADDDVADETATVTLTLPGSLSGSVAVTVTDDDVQSILPLQTAVSFLESEQVSVGVRLAFRPAADMVVTVASSDQTVATVTPATLTFSPTNYALPQFVNIAGIDDLDLIDEPATISLTAGGLVANIAAQVIDDDVLNVQVNPTALDLVEGGANGTFTVVLTQQPTNAVTMTVVSSDPGATPIAPAALTFDAMNWDQPQTVTVTPAQDDDTVSESTRVTLTTPGLGDRVVTVRVTDDDTQAIVLDNPTLDLTEGGIGGRSVRLAFDPVNPVTVTIVSNDTGAAQVNPATLTFTSANYTNPQNVAVTAVEDRDLANETVIVTLTSPVAANVPLTVNITDDDTQTIQVSQTVVNLDENEATTIAVTLGFAPTNNVQITIVSGDGAAVAVNPPALTFTPQTFSSPQLVTITALDDVDTTDEAVNVVLAGAGAPDQAIAVTVDDDDDQFLILSATRVTVTEESVAPSTFTIRPAFDPGTPLIVTITSRDPAAATMTPGTLTFTSANYQTPQTISVNGVMDVDIADETVRVDVTSPTTAAVEVVVIVTDDDDQALVVNPVSVNLTEGGTGTFDVNLAFEPGAPVSITLVSADAGAATIAPNTLMFDGNNFATPQRVTITGVQDNDTAGEAVTITVFGGVAPNVQVTANIADDDRQTMVLSADTFNLTEGESAMMGVNLAFNPLGTTTVMLTSANAAAASVAPTTLTFNAGNFAVPQQVRIVAVQDDDTANANNVRLTLTSPVAMTRTATVNVTDDDTQVVVVTPAGGIALTEGQTRQISVSLGFNPITTATVTLATSDPGAGSISTTALVFSGTDWSIPQMVTITAEGDDDTVDEAVTITLSGVAEAQTIALTIDDDDTQALAVSQTMFTLMETGTGMFTVALAFDPVNDVMVTIASSDAGAASTNPAVLTFTSANYATPQMVTLTAEDDDDTLDEAVTLTVSGGGAPTNITVAITVGDDDTQAIMAAPTMVTVVEDTTATLMVSLAANPVTPTSVTVVSSDSGAASVSPTTLNFNATNWATPQAVTIRGVDDNDTISENVTLTLSSIDAPTVQIPVTVTDPDTQVLVVSGTNFTVREQGQITFTARLTYNPVAMATVTITSANGAIATVAPAALTFDANNFNVPQQVTITGVMDDDVADEMTTLTLAGAGAPANVTVNVTVDDDDVQGVVLNRTTVTVGEGQVSNALTVALAFNPQAMTAINFASANPAVATVVAALTFDATNWGTPQAVAITGVEDNDVVNGNTSITVSSPVVNGQSSINVTVTDNDTQTIMIQNQPTTVAEGGTAVFQVRLSNDPLGTTTINIVSSNPAGATVTTPVTVNSGNYTTFQPVTITGVDDNNLLDETADIAVTSPAATGAINFSIAVTDTDTQTIILTPEATTVAEGATQVYSVRLSNDPTTLLVVNIASSDVGAATTNRASINFTNLNWNVPQNVTITTTDDDDVNPETVTLTHSANQVANALMTVTVTDPDTQAIIATPTTLMIGEQGQPGSFTARLAFNPVDPAVVSVTSDDADAVLPNTMALNFNATNWMTPQTVTVTGVGDNDAMDESIGVVLATGIALNDATVTVAVDDDDDQDIEVDMNTIMLNEGESGQVMVTLAQDPVVPTTVTVTSPDAMAVSRTPATLTFDSANYFMPQPVTLTAEADDDAGDESVQVELTAAGIPTATVLATVDDDEIQTIVLSANNLSFTEGGPAQMITVTLGASPGENTVNVGIASDAGDGLTLSATTLAFDMTNWNVGLPLTLTPPQDDDATSESGTLTFSATNVANALLTYDIADNDTQGIVFGTFNLTTLVCEEGEETMIAFDEGDTRNVCVRLAARPEATIDVTSTSNDLLIALVDPQVRQFDATNWNTLVRYGVQGQQDVDLDNETTSITFDAQGVGGLPARDVGVFIWDNDVQGVIVTPESVALDEGAKLGATVMVSLAFAPTAGQGGMVTLTSSDNGVAFAVTQNLMFTAANYNVPQAVVISAADDPDTRDEVGVITVADNQIQTTEAGPIGPATSTVAVTVDDDDTQMLVIVADNPEIVTEQGAQGAFSVALAFEPDGATQVDITTADAGAATPGTTTLVFGVNDYTMPQTVNVVGEMDDDVADELTTFTLQTTTASVAEPQTVNVMVLEDDVQAIVTSTDSVTLVEETMTTFTVRLAFRPSATTTVDLTAVDPEVAGAAPLNLVFAPGAYATEQVVTVSAPPDQNLVDQEADIALSTPAVATATVVATVTDDDVQRIITSTMTIALDEGDDDTYTVRLAFEPINEEGECVFIESDDPGAVDVFFVRGLEVAEGVKQQGVEFCFDVDDYDQPRTVVVVAWDDTDTRDEVVPIYHTSDAEDPETATATVTVMVEDDDVQRIINTPVTVRLDEGGKVNQADVNVRLEFRPTTNRVVFPVVAQMGKVFVTPPSVTFTPMNYLQTQAFTVIALQDDDMLNDIVDVVFTSTTPTTIATSVTTATITDDDPGRQRILLSEVEGVSVTEGLDTPVTVELRFQPSEDTIITLVSDDTAAFTVQPSMITFNSTNWNMPVTATLTGTPDDTDLNDDDARLTLADARDPMHPEHAPDEVLFVFVEDDDEQQIVVTTVPATLATSVQESGPPATFFVELAFDPRGGEDETVVITSTAAGGRAGGLLFNPPQLTFSGAGAAQMVQVSAANDADVSHHLFGVNVFSTTESVMTIHPVRVIDDEVPVTSSTAYAGYSGATLFTKRQNVRWGATRMLLSAYDGAGNTVVLNEQRELGDMTVGPTLGLTGAVTPVEAIEFDAQGNFGVFTSLTTGINFARIRQDNTLLNSNLVTGTDSVDFWPVFNGNNYALLWRSNVSSNLRGQSVEPDGSTAASVAITVADGTPDLRPNMHFRAGANQYTVIFSESGSNNVGCVNLDAAGIPLGGVQTLQGFPANAPFLSTVWVEEFGRIFAAFIDPTTGLRIGVINPADPQNGCVAETIATLRGVDSYASPPPFIAFNGVEFAVAYDREVALQDPRVGVVIVGGEGEMISDYDLGTGSRPSVEWVTDRWAVRYQDATGNNTVRVAVGAFTDHCVDGDQNVDELGVDCGGADCDECVGDFPPLRVFVTASSTHTGNLGGLDGADATCQVAANRAEVPGRYRAWIGDDGVGPNERFTQSPFPYVLTNGTVIAQNYTDLTDGTLAAPINIDEDGNQVTFAGVWTGASEDGSGFQGSSCAGWTSLQGQAAFGFESQTGAGWSANDGQGCDVAYRLYCFEQPRILTDLDVSELRQRRVAQ